ncbi:MAG: glycosyl transferase [Bacteroides sp.]|jgi:hypothetical protein|nr:glycosyl transferase [Bacteroides sp.]MCI1684049.1 glycosyl transferase [Bacteroides sp.]
MKHAYLIIAHHEFEVLQKLVLCLDDCRNDIFIHFDKKVEHLPVITTEYAHLFILAHRINVHWGNISQIKVEYILFEEASKQGTYQYYHLISGVHLPLRSQDNIHAFFSQIQGSEVLTEMPTSVGEIALKMQKYNLFTVYFAHRLRIVRRFNQLLWRAFIILQKAFHISVNTRTPFYKASNWVSLTSEGVSFLLSKKREVLRKYRFSFCGDEFFVPSELENSSFKARIRYESTLLKCDFKGANSRIYRMSDYQDLMRSDCLFARKFSHDDMEVVNNIVKQVISTKK